MAESWLAAVRNDPNVLIVADNLERPDILRSLPGLPSCALTSLDCRLLVTSRQRDLPGCQDVEVERLPLPASCALLEREAGIGDLALAEGEALEWVARILGGLPLTLRIAGALVRVHGASFADLASVLNEDGVLVTLDVDNCPLDDYRTDADRALGGLIEECLKSIPAHRAEWLDVLKTLAILPENAVVRGEFLRHFFINDEKT